MNALVADKLRKDNDEYAVQLEGDETPQFVEFAHGKVA